MAKKRSERTRASLAAQCREVDMIAHEESNCHRQMERTAIDTKTIYKYMKKIEYTLQSSIACTTLLLIPF